MATTSRCTCTGRWRPRRARCGSSCSATASPSRSPTSCRSWRTWASTSSTSARTRCDRPAPTRSGSTTSGCATSSSPTSTPRGCASASRRPSPWSGAATWRTTGSTGWCSAPGCGGARSPSCGPTRSTSGRSAPPSRWTTPWRRSPTIPGWPAGSSSSSRSGWIPMHAVDRDLAAKHVVHDFEGGLDAVTSLNEDRVLRALLRVVEATLRTNYFQAGPDGAAKPWLAIKLASGQIPDLPLPRPAFEIFVYSPRVEGVHLRGGSVARGGLRWSDRPEDFRTEVLGLMKAQTVKNAVIVPVGAKGGFVVKNPPQDRDALQAEVVACYSTFIRGLLDVTDNLVGRRGRPARARRALRRGRRVPRRGGRQGHRDLLRHRQRHLPGVRVLAGRRLRLRWLGRLRPQGDGHHGARRLGLRPAPLPRPRRRRAERGLHGRRHRGHVGRRLRQRDAAVRSTSAWWPPSTTGTSSSTPIPTRRPASRSAPGCSASPVPAGRTTTHR